MKKLSITLISFFLVFSLIAQTKVVHLTSEEFKTKVFNYEKETEWKYNGSQPAIVDFYADWCMPCRMLAPTLDEISNEYNGKLTVYKVNTQHEPNVASAFGITGIPALLFIPNSGKPQMATGLLPKETLVEYIGDILRVK